MKLIRYFFQFLFISFLFIIFKILGLKLSRIIAGKFFSIFGPFFRSKEIIKKNISYAFSNINQELKRNILNKMWTGYGKS